MADVERDEDRLPALVRTYERQRSARARARWVTEALVDGLFLGLMDDRDLVALDRAFYANATELVAGHARRYDEEAHICSGLNDWEARAAQDTFPAGGRVVVTSAGAGREIFGLQQLGFDAVGFEPNEHLVTAGRRVLARNGDADRLLVCDRDVFPTTDRADAVVIGWGSYTLIRGTSRRVALLKGARDVVTSGAPLLVSFFARPDRGYFRTVSIVASALRRLQGEEPVEHGDALSPNFVHYFSRTEIEDELRAAGFQPERFVAWPYAHVIARAA
jgi:hypothetical protein